MIRETDLVSYLPPFLAEYREINEALSAEDPEFGLVWKAADKALKNEFIATADEYGISRFEKMLGIFPMPGESTETRRQRVQLKWLAMLPYTLPRLRETLEAVLGPGGFLLDPPGAETYCMRLVILNQADEIYFSVAEMLREWVPANIVYDLESRGTGKQNAGVYAGAARAEYIAVLAEPAEENVRFSTSAELVADTAIYKYYRAGYRPKEES